jgi:DNA replication protein DnaC
LVGSFASALGRKACRDNRSVLYQRVPRFLILDDWGLAPLDAGARHDLLEILEGRYGRRSIINARALSICPQ